MSAAPSSLLRELRGLLRTPEVARPRVYRCAGCHRSFRSDERHDYARCTYLAKCFARTEASA